jgi:hypothetical protein
MAYGHQVGFGEGYYLVLLLLLFTCCCRGVELPHALQLSSDTGQQILQLLAAVQLLLLLLLGLLLRLLLLLGLLLLL